MQAHGSGSPDVDRRLAHDPLAIVGLAGRFPKARDVREFWSNVVSARDCCDIVPESWWSTEHHYDPNPFAEDKTYCRRGGFLTPEIFDPREFGMPPNTIDSTGLVQLLALVVAKETLHDAGCSRENWYEPARTGVVLGVCGTNSTVIPLAARLLAPQLAETMRAFGVPEKKTKEILGAQLAAFPQWTEDSFPGILGNVVSGRIANRLNLGAANHTVDAACASSLTALRSAADELLSRRADVMLAGGCDADNSILSFMCFSKTPALSFSGRVRPFDEEADGTLLGEGVGMVALKRLGDAERDGDRIYAVLRGIGSSSDGRAQSIYAPCGNGQSTALRRAYHDAGCSPRSVELIEAHGTGTSAGDRTELSALDELLAVHGEPHRVAVGSVKSQIGHAKAAAGVAGLIKAALALRHKVLPPTVNVTAPVPQTLQEDSALYVNTAARPWIRDPSQEVRRAGVSAFGFGGVNYHAVLEEPPGGDAQQEFALHTTPRACLWHAPDADALRHLLESGAAPHEGTVPAGHARVGFVAAGPDEYEELLARTVELLARGGAGPDGCAGPDGSGSADCWNHPRGIHYRSSGVPAETKVGALFTGQGSQYVEMGLHAALGLPPVRAAFDAANSLFPAEDSLARSVFPPPGTGEPAAHSDRLRRTSHAQPAIGALSMGQYRYLRELGFAPHGLLGHSFGELSALWAAGVLTDDAFTALARARGLAMEQPPGRGGDPGALAAVRMPESRLREVLAEHRELSVSSRNAPGEHTVGGPTPAVRRFVEWCAERGLAARQLPVAAAFHTSHVHHAAEEFAAACAEQDFTPPAVPVYADTASAAYGPDAGANRRTLVDQLCRPVDFAARLEEMYADGIRVFVEFGPGRTVTGLVERTLGERGAEVVGCDDGPGTDSCAALKRAALRLAVLGVPLSGINRYDAPPRPERPAPSKVARTLEGPVFASEKLRPAYEKRLANAAREAQEEAAAEPAPAPAATGRSDETDPLSRAAAEHLAAHTRYLDGQLRTAERLTGLLQEGAAGREVPQSLAAAVHAVAEHSVALGEAHTRAGEVVTELLRLPGGGQSPERDRTRGVDREAGADSAGRSAVIPHQNDGPGEGPAPEAEPEAASEAGEPAVPDNSALLELWAGAGATAGQGAADGKSVDPQEVERVFRTVVAERTGYELDMIEPDMYIQEDLGIDSLKQVEIGAEMWRRYPAMARTEMYRFSEARTVGDLTKIMHEIITSPKSRLHLGSHAGTRSAFVSLRELPRADVCADVYAERPRALLLDDGGELPAALARSLSAEGWRLCRLSLPGADEARNADGAEVRRLADWREETLSAQLAALLADGHSLDLCVLPVSGSADEEAARAVERLQHAVFVAKHTRPALEATAEAGTRAGFVTVTRLDGRLGYAGAGGSPVGALAGGLGGLVKTLTLEATTLFCRALDFAPGLSEEEVAAAFTAELGDLATDVREVGLDGSGRRTPVMSDAPPALLPAPRKTAELARDDLLLVTGGAAGVTAWCVEALAEEHGCGYLLLGRTPLEEEPDWAAGLDGAEELREALKAQAREAGEDPADERVRARIEQHSARLLQQRGIRGTLAALRSHGAEAHYLAADVRDAAAVAGALEPYAARITGVLHGAGILRDRALAEVTPESVAAVVDTKLSGLCNVLEALDPDRLRHLVLFSSVAGIWGNVRQGDYALANEALNRFGCAFQAAHPDCRVLPIAWGPWSGGMGSAVQQVFTDIGVPVLSREEGCAHFLAHMAPESTGAAVAVIGPTTPLHLRVDPLPERGGRTAYRTLTGLENEPVLRDHSFGGVPVLPMTAAVGWGLNAVERATGGVQPVVECRDFRIAGGVFFTGGHPERFRMHLAPDPANEPDGAPAVRVTVEEAGPGGKLRYEGRFLQAAQAPEAPRTDVLSDVPSVPSLASAGEPHPGYADGRLFHGPSLAGLRDVLAEGPDRLVVAARLPDPGLANGAYAGRLFSPAPADLLLQAALPALQRNTDSKNLPLPVAVRRVELFTPLPDDEPFVVVVDIDHDEGDFFAECTLTACAVDGRVHQRWSGVRVLWTDPAAAHDRLATSADAARVHRD